MNNTRWLISGPPRTGGHLLLGIIQSAGVLCLHTHNPRYKTKNDSLATLIRLRRKNIFAALMSNCLVWHTGQSNNYSCVDIQPFEVTKNEFLKHYEGHICYHATAIKESRFLRVQDIYFEDFLHDHNWVYKLLNLSHDHLTTQNSKITQLLTNKCPYHYSNLILNHLELCDYFNQLQSQDITTMKINNPYDRSPKRSQKKQTFT